MLAGLDLGHYGVQHTPNFTRINNFANRPYCRRCQSSLHDSGTLIHHRHLSGATLPTLSQPGLHARMKFGAICRHAAGTAPHRRAAGMADGRWNAIKVRIAPASALDLSTERAAGGNTGAATKAGVSGGVTAASSTTTPVHPIAWWFIPPVGSYSSLGDLSIAEPGLAATLKPGDAQLAVLPERAPKAGGRAGKCAGRHPCLAGARVSCADRSVRACLRRGSP